MNLSDSFKIGTYKLNNGLRIALIPINNSQIISMNLAYKVGSKNEHPGHTGLAHLFEHLMFEGTKNVPKGEFDKICSLAGGINNAYTSYDITAYTMSLPSNQLETALWLESDRMLEFSVTEEALATQQKVVSEEIRQTVFDRPYGKWREMLSEYAYRKDSPYSWEVHGKIEDVQKATLDYLRHFFEMYYRPGNAILSLCGNFNNDETLELIKKYFGPIGNKSVENNKIDFDKTMLKYGSNKSVTDSIPLPAVFINFHIPGFMSDDILIADILSNISSSGRSSRLYSELIEKKQIASSVGSFVDKREYSSILTFYGITANTDVSLEELKHEMLDIIYDFSSHYVTKDELQKNINQLTTSLANEIQYSSGIADLVSSNLLFNDDCDRIYRILEKIRHITREDIKSFASNCLNDSKEVVIEYYPET